MNGPQCWQGFDADPGGFTPFFRTSVQVGKSPMGVAFGILWNGRVVRVNVANLKGVAFGIFTCNQFSSVSAQPSRPEPLRDRQTGNPQKKKVRCGDACVEI